MVSNLVSIHAARFRPDDEEGQLVGRPAAHVHRPRGFCRLLDMGGVPGRSLLGAGHRLPFAVLFARDIWEFTALIARAKPSWIPAWLPFSPALLILWAPGRISFYLLLLSRGLLQGDVGGPGRMCCRRASSRVPWRKLVPANHSKYSPVFSLPRDHFYFHARPRRLEGNVVRRAR